MSLNSNHTLPVVCWSEGHLAAVKVLRDAYVTPDDATLHYDVCPPCSLQSDPSFRLAELSNLVILESVRS